jgi:hypothetical protein
VKKDRLAKAKAELAQIDNAITMIRSLTRADLQTLYKRKDTLEDLISALSGGSGRFRRVIPIG